MNTSRLARVLEYIAESKNVSDETKEILKAVSDLDDEISYLDHEDFIALFVGKDGEQPGIVDVVENTLNIDISDVE